MRPPPTRLRRFGEVLSLAGMISGFAFAEFYMWPGIANAWALLLWMPAALFGAMVGALPGWLFTLAADRRLAKSLGVSWRDVQPKYPRAKMPPFLE